MIWLELALITGCALFLFTALKGENLLLAASGDEDADMKIAPGSGGSIRDTEPAAEEAEAEAQNYLRQKSSGNIDLARALGSSYAALVMAEAKDKFDPWPEGMAEALQAHHALLLFSYVINRVVADLSHNSILAQTTLNVFYCEIETKAPGLDKYIRDMASYSLYILCERSSQCPTDQVGKIFARLCGDKDNERLIARGHTLFADYYARCKQLHEQTRYAQV
ncbi:MAG: hypothetical protein FWE32_07690 [Oscillospiraceae bacterium]|nr:hypothetical protein [Oscillospiraceae bacterium]